MEYFAQVTLEADDYLRSFFFGSNLLPGSDTVINLYRSQLADNEASPINSNPRLAMKDEMDNQIRKFEELLMSYMAQIDLGQWTEGHGYIEEALFALEVSRKLSHRIR